VNVSFVDKVDFEQPVDGRLVGRICNITKSCHNDALWTAQLPYPAKGDPNAGRLDACADHMPGLLATDDGSGNGVIPRRIGPPEDSNPIMLESPGAAPETTADGE
jgi:hypothetical protein